MERPEKNRENSSNQAVIETQSVGMRRDERETDCFRDTYAWVGPELAWFTSRLSRETRGIRLAASPLLSSRLVSRDPAVQDLCTYIGDVGATYRAALTLLASRALLKRFSRDLIKEQREPPSSRAFSQPVKNYAFRFLWKLENVTQVYRWVMWNSLYYLNRERCISLSFSFSYMYGSMEWV